MDSEGNPSPRGDPGREAWISAALRVLAGHGPEALRIERIARELNTSKGPFYWRFAGRAELLRAVLRHWRAERTGRLIEAVSGLPTPRARLEALAGLALAETTGAVDVARLEGAFRAWAAHDPAAAAAVREVDAERLRHLDGELRRLGAPAAEARVLGHAIYLALIGLYAARCATPGLAEDAAFRRVVALALDAAEGAARAAANLGEGGAHDG